jgi:predicted ribonuclease YlaK
MKKVLFDTNVLIEDSAVIDSYDAGYVCLPVLEELDKLKASHDSETAYKARETIRKLHKSNVNYLIDNIELGKNDNKILDYALRYECKIITNDVNLQLKAKALGIEVESYKPVKINYAGYKEIEFTDEELADWYLDKRFNKWELLDNEYLIVKHQDNVVGVWKYLKGEFLDVFNREIDSKTLGKLKGLDVYQQCAIDSLYSNQVTMIKGRAGSGKSLLALTYAMSEIEGGEYRRLVIFTNPVSVMNSAKLGYYPGDKDEKLLSSNIGNMLISKFGDRLALEMLIQQNKLVLLPFSDIRGYDTSGMKAIVYISEAQNLDVNLMKIASQRVGNDCKLIIDGDYETQVDMASYSGNQNGMRRFSEVFRGHNFYGEVELKNIYRSKIAEVADRM